MQEINTNNSRTSRTRYSSLISTFQFLQTPLSSLVSHYFPLPQNPNPNFTFSNQIDLNTTNNDGATEVSIQILTDHDSIQSQIDDNDGGVGELGVNELSRNAGVGDIGVGDGGDDDQSLVRGSSGVEQNVGSGGDDSGSSSLYEHRYDLQQAARVVERVIPFSFLLLLVFIRQHLQGFFVTIYITAFMFKSNDILKKQTVLKGERKLSVLVGYCIVFMLHVIGYLWWYWNEDILNPLIMVPPKAIPPFWHAIFAVLVSDTMVRVAAMAFKLILLMYYRNGRAHDFRRQGQLLTLVEYTLLLYRTLLPTPVWYRFFLNKDYGSLFSSLTTGLYLTFKLTSVVEKVRSFFSALKALSRKEMHYGSYATLEQVNDAGDLCAICQEKLHVPVLLCCKHVFCEDCVSEWFERERTCPLCREVVRPADLKSYGDGSTNLFVQLY
ncbi:RING finger and transmembrane domain-containing protein 2 [Heracleum sosnowskyi]|uniref:RING finger and transmembrane domain-containing protein 2 n=1 Tax=Heracleum sosnowskyi TaxID=360622 RepID=A0AAD8JA81_9APIA|nr:RING finger and transmembrane domain-containing protein 2 [Heracleum sosnowskyi]